MPTTFEKLQGNLAGAYFRRINIKHRLVYEMLEQEKIVKIISMWPHYDFCWRLGDTKSPEIFKNIFSRHLLGSALYGDTTASFCKRLLFTDYSQL